jgi:hypothetical protein
VTNIDESFQRSMTRRAVLAGLASSIAVYGAKDETDAAANLYVYPGSRAGTTVLAVELPPRHLAPRLKVRIHAGRNAWTVTAASNANTRTLLTVNVPTDTFEANGAAGIWAECLWLSGKRRRIASPFLAQILSDDELLASRYHNIHPSDDKAELTEPVAKGIARIVSANSTRIKPEEYADRLARVLLPDLLHYDPRQPFGFTFAARNGRHPNDPSNAVVRAVLSGNAEG